MKRDLVLIHGALGAGKQFDELVPSLNQTFSVHVYEISGHGKRATENIPFTIENFALDFKEFLSGFDHPVHVFGFSMGGYVSLYLAKTNPHLFDTIVTLGTKFRWSVEESLKETQKLNVEILETKVPQYCGYLELLHDLHWKSVVEKTKQMMLRLGENPLLNENSCKEIKTKTILMLGELDKMVSKEETERIEISLVNAEFKLLPGFVHPLEKLEKNLLAETLKSVFK
jgi:pimeloyl-ACP methyl ester carboxylesterase